MCIRDRRCTVQKANHRSLCEVVEAAKAIGLNSISFLAADLTSEAFNRPQGWVRERQDLVALNSEEADALEAEVERLVVEHRIDLNSGFVVESPDKLRRIVLHFRAHLGQAQQVLSLIHIYKLLRSEVELERLRNNPAVDQNAIAEMQSKVSDVRAALTSTAHEVEA